MIVLNSGDQLRGHASTQGVVDYTVYGMDDGALTLMAEGQMTNTSAVLYQANSTDVVSQVIMVNGDATERTVNLFVVPSGSGIPRRVVPKDLVVGSGYACYTNGSDLILSGPQTSTGAPLTETEGGTGQTTYTAGDILYASDTDTLDQLAKGSDGQMLSLVNGLPAWADGQDLTGAEIKSLYEAEDDTNAFTDAEQTKLAGIEAGATGDMTGAEIKAAYEAESDTNAFTDSEKTKLEGIEEDSTADQDGAEIKALYEAEDDTNAFTDAEQTKLAGIEAQADVTDATNVEAAGAMMATAMIDEDNMASNSAAHVPTQQSVKTYVDGIVDAAPEALNTLNELAAALDDDASFASTMTNALGEKLPLAGGNMSGAITFHADQQFDGRDLSADGTKLDTVEESADVTDATNVEAAGAMMASSMIDEDDMTSDSETHVPTQQSVKTYVDNTSIKWSLVFGS